ncbi:MAG TPA: CPBP family intramembrane glutamic endopeptidase [Actinomycetota bacterium]
MIAAVSSERVRPMTVALALVAGAALFAVRPLVALDPNAAPLLLAGLYLALWGVSTAPHVPSPAGATAARVMSLPGALAIGAVAVVLVRFTADPVVPPDRRLIAVALGLAAAVAEEAYFRRLLHPVAAFGGAVVAIVAGAALFAAMHWPSYGSAAMPLDFGAGLLFAWQRWATGSWTAPAATHALANLLSAV